MKKIVTLKELNAKGQLICQFKEVAFVNSSIQRRPFLHPCYNPTTCYLHYYNDNYYVTDHVINTRQDVFNVYDDALYRFRYIVSNF